MGIKKIGNEYKVSLHKRHPITCTPRSLVRSGIKTMAEAKRVYNELVIQMHEGLTKKMFPTWKKFVNDFYDYRRKNGVFEKTIHSELACIGKWTFDEWSEKTLDSFKSHEISGYFSKIFKDVNIGHQKYLATKIRAVFQHAVDQGVIEKNPMPQMKHKTCRTIPLTLNEAQASLLLEKAREIDHDWYPIWASAVYTGMRSGELYALRWENVDLDNRKIFVRMSWNKRDGFKETKSGHHRVVPIAESLLPVLRELKIAGMWGDFVLPRLRLWDGGEQAKALRNFETAIGLPPARFHSLRATWATTLLLHKTSMLSVMNMGGWEDAETMMLYARKAGVDVAGLTDSLQFHDHNQKLGAVIELRK